MSAAATFDVCDPSAIYTPSYSYSLPRPALEGMLSGKAFDHKVTYTETELQALKNDIREIYAAIQSAQPTQARVAVITAGAPGAGKTFLMRADLEKCKKAGTVYGYIDPDDVCLRQQTRTRGADIAKSDGTPAAHKDAYNKWRPGSNAANHLILGNLIREGQAFHFGTTSTGPVTHLFFKFLKQQGYQIRLIYVAAPDAVRWGSIQERDKTFVQTTEQDTREKGDLLPQRINDTFLAYADTIEFHYRDDVKKDATLAATWVRYSETSESAGTLRVLNADAYNNIKTIHNAVITRLAKPELKWEETVEKRSHTPAEEKMARMQAYQAFLPAASAATLELIEGYITG